MEKIKVITICGSLRFQQKIMEIVEKLELQGNCVLAPVYPTRDDKDKFTEEEAEILNKSHFYRISLSDSIFVVNKFGYIGENVKKEIQYAVSLGKKVEYLESPLDGTLK